jgi:NADP-dependent 3-hydroxy acid dehydrogenase YdfG
VSGPLPGRTAINARPLAGRTAIVTGASRGIGLATARALAAAGARVALLARSADTIAKLAAELGGGAFAVPCDVTDETAIARAAAAVRDAFGDAPEILVNNAGIFVPAPVALTSVEKFRETIAVDLVAPFLFVRAVLPRMIERGNGHIVTIGSNADRNAFQENGSYSAARYGGRGLHEVMRAELRGTGVRATLVSPSSVDTTIWDGVDPARRSRFPSREAMLAADDVAAAVLYAVSQPPRVNIDELRLSRA